MDKSIKIFGREPAVWVGVIEAFLAVLLSFGIGITESTYGPIMAVVVALGGFVTALGTKDTLLGALIGVIKAGVVLIAVFGISLSEQQTGALIAAVSVVFALYQRTQTSPIADPVDPSPAQVVPVPAPADVKEGVDEAAANGELIPVDAGSVNSDVVGAPQEPDADTVVVSDPDFDTESDVIDTPSEEPDNVEPLHDNDRVETEGK
jgi:hypothetical protein